MVVNGQIMIVNQLTGECKVSEAESLSVGSPEPDWVKDYKSLHPHIYKNWVLHNMTTSESYIFDMLQIRHAAATVTRGWKDTEYQLATGANFAGMFSAWDILPNWDFLYRLTALTFWGYIVLTEIWPALVAYGNHMQPRFMRAAEEQIDRVRRRQLRRRRRRQRPAERPADALELEAPPPPFDWNITLTEGHQTNKKS